MEVNEQVEGRKVVVVSRRKEDPGYRGPIAEWDLEVQGPLRRRLLRVQELGWCLAHALLPDLPRRPDERRTPSGSDYFLRMVFIPSPLAYSALSEIATLVKAPKATFPHISREFPDTSPWGN